MNKFLSVSVVLLCVLFCGSLIADSLEKGLGVAVDIQKEGAESQGKVDKMALKTEKMLDEYKRLMTDADYQNQYLEELKQLQKEQEKQIAQLNNELNGVQYTQRRITPLLHSMVEALEQFIVLDLPFHQQDRIESVLALRSNVSGGELSISDKFRIVMEAFQIELAYGNSIESYRGNIMLEGESVVVQQLRIGRTGLYYQTLDGENSAMWDRIEKRWKPLSDEFNQTIARSIRVANDQLAPELLKLPMVSLKKGEEK